MSSVYLSASGNFIRQETLFQMHNFLLKRRPLSYNSCRGNRKINYELALRKSFTEYNPSHTLMTGNLYATIYYFYNKNLDLDTDNLSKPVWDCLNNFLYTDDKQIKIRIAGSFDLSKGDYNIIDFSGLKGSFVIDLLEAFESEDHIIYIECGLFKPSFLKFNLQ